MYELEKAYQCAISKRQGPVWLDIPLDIQAEEIEISKIGKKLKKLSINRSIKKLSLKKLIPN